MRIHALSGPGGAIRPISPSPASRFVRKGDSLCAEALLQHVIKNLVRTATCKIDRCSCGAVHVSVGATTVRISDGAARELRDALTRALVEVDGRQSLAPTPVIHLVDTRGDEDPDDGGSQLH